MNKFAKICLGIAGVIILTFFIVQTCIVMRWCEPTYFLAEVGYGCVIAFMPPFFYVVYDFIRTTKLKEANIDLQLSAIDKSNLVVMMDMDGYILEANNKFCSAMKCKESDMKKKSHRNMVTKDYAKSLEYVEFSHLFSTFPKTQRTLKSHRNMVTKDYAKSLEYVEFWEKLRRGESITGEFERVAKDGSSIWLFGNYTPIQNSKGQYDKVLKIATDITLQHESEVMVNQKNSYLEHAAKILRHDMHSGINTYMPRGLTSLRRRLNEEQIKELKIESPLKMLEEGLRHTQKVYAGVKEFTNLVKKDVQLNKQPHNLGE